MTIRRLFYRIKPRLTGEWVALGVFVRHNHDGYPIGRGSHSNWSAGVELIFFGVGVRVTTVMK